MSGPHLAWTTPGLHRSMVQAYGWRRRIDADAGRFMAHVRR